MNWVSVFFILLAVAAYGLLHSWLASLTVKASARRWFGAWADRSYRLGYNLLAVVAFLPILVLVSRLPDRRLYVIPFPWVLLTSAIQAAAGVALLVGMLQTGLWKFLGLRQLIEPAGGDPCAPEAHLVVTGLYRHVRHPLYTAGLVLIWLTPVMTVNFLALASGLSAYILIGAWLEERKLLREYGEAYVSYRQQTPMLIPTFWKKKGS